MDGAPLTTPETFDAALRLLDRQIVDRDGALVGKVDDVELTEAADGRLVVSGLLLGAPALIPRFGGRRAGGWLLERWRRLGLTRGDRTTPQWIDIDDVDGLSSEVRVRPGRDGITTARWPDPTRHRLGHLLEFQVVRDDRPTHLRVLDARLARAGELGRSEVHVVGLIIGRNGRPGSLLGYERTQDRGPWIVAAVVRALHRHVVHVPWPAVSEIDWENRVIHVGRGG